MILAVLLQNTAQFESITNQLYIVDWSKKIGFWYQGHHAQFFLTAVEFLPAKKKLFLVYKIDEKIANLYYVQLISYRFRFSKICFRNSRNFVIFTVFQPSFYSPFSRSVSSPVQVDGLSTAATTLRGMYHFTAQITLPLVFKLWFSVGRRNFL